MAQKIISGVAIEVNEEGYFTNPAQWTRELGMALALEEGFRLTEKHIEIIDFLREQYAKGKALTIRSVGDSGIIDIKGFYGLFPGAPMKRAAKIAGIPKPSSCL